MYTSIDIAKVFLQFAEEDEIEVTSMKLLKLTYISYGFHLGFFSKELFQADIQAWRYGPVIQNLYVFTSRFLRKGIKVQDIEAFSFISIDQKDREFIRIIWNQYKVFTAYQLSEKTHQEGSPWSQVYDEEVREKSISSIMIAKYYKDLVSEFLLNISNPNKLNKADLANLYFSEC